jgi:hypothetical protein
MYLRTQEICRAFIWQVVKIIKIIVKEKFSGTFKEQNFPNIKGKTFPARKIFTAGIEKMLGWLMA